MVYAGRAPCAPYTTGARQHLAGEAIHHWGVAIEPRDRHATDRIEFAPFVVVRVEPTQIRGDRIEPERPRALLDALVEEAAEVREALRAQADANAGLLEKIVQCVAPSHDWGGKTNAEIAMPVSFFSS